MEPREKPEISAKEIEKKSSPKGEQKKKRPGREPWSADRQHVVVNNQPMWPRPEKKRDD